MKFLLILLSLLITLAHGCMPPFNDYRYAENDTLMHEAIAQYKSNPEGGWLAVLENGSPIKPWPKNHIGISAIKFCYADDYSKSKIGLIFVEAWNKWYNVLGNAGAGKGHRMGGFQETQENGESVYCFTDFTRKIWNPKVPDDTLQINADPGKTGSSATVGYRPAEWDNGKGRHQMKIGWKNDDSFDRAKAVYTTAHEMGHIFGFRHEHQRPDREHYIKFQCENLNNYAAVVAELPNHPGDSIEDLCSSATASRVKPWTTIGFGAYDFAIPLFWESHKDKDGNWDGHKWPWLEVWSLSYDRNSIMQYDSLAFSRPEVNDRTAAVNNVPLVMWKAGGPDYKAPTTPTDEWAFVMRVSWESGPSEGDVAGVKVMYPWENK